MFPFNRRWRSVVLAGVWCLLAGPADANPQLMQSVRTGLAGGQTVKTQMAGFSILQHAFEERPPESGVLIGLDVALGNRQLHQGEIVFGIRPYYLTPRGELAFQDFGHFGPPPLRGKKAWPHKITRLVQLRAQPGYAVGAIKVRSGLWVDGLSLTFHKIVGTQLDPNQATTSEWAGSFGGNERVLSSHGAPVVGVFGNLDDSNLIAIGLIHLKPQVRLAQALPPPLAKKAAPPPPVNGIENPEPAPKAEEEEPEDDAVPRDPAKASRASLSTVTLAITFAIPIFFTFLGFYLYSRKSGVAKPQVESESSVSAPLPVELVEPIERTGSPPPPFLQLRQASSWWWGHHYYRAYLFDKTVLFVDLGTPEEAERRIPDLNILSAEGLYQWASTQPTCFTAPAVDMAKIVLEPPSQWSNWLGLTNVARLSFRHRHRGRCRFEFLNLDDVRSALAEWPNFYGPKFQANVLWDSRRQAFLPKG